MFVNLQSRLIYYLIFYFLFKIHFSYVYILFTFKCDFRKLWEILLIVFYILQYITIPLDALGYILFVLPTFKWTLRWTILRTMLDFFSLVNVFVNFSSGYYDIKRSIVVLDPYDVSK